MARQQEERDQLEAVSMVTLGASSSGGGGKSSAPSVPMAAAAPVASGAGVTTTSTTASTIITSPRSGAGPAATTIIHHKRGRMESPGLHLSPPGHSSHSSTHGRRSPSPLTLQRTNSTPSPRSGSPVDSGLLSPTQPPYRSVSHIVGYTPEGSTSRCRVCERGFTPGKLRFGTFFAHSEGFIFLRWHHLRCVRAPASVDDVSQLTGHNDLRPIDREAIQAWITQGPQGLALFSPPSSPSGAPSLRASLSIDVAGGRGGSGSGRRSVSPTSPPAVMGVGGAFFNAAPSSSQQRPILQRARTSPISFEEPPGHSSSHSSSSSSGMTSTLRRTTSSNSTSNSAHSSDSGTSSGSSGSNSGRRSPPLGPAAKQQLSPSPTAASAAAAAARRIVEIPSESDAVGSAHATSPPRAIPSNKRPERLRLGTSPDGVPHYSTSSPTLTSPRGSYGQSSGCLLDARLPSPRELTRRTNQRPKSPLLLFSDQRSPRAASPRDSGSKKGPPKTEWEALKVIAKAVRRRQRRRSV